MDGGLGGEKRKGVKIHRGDAEMAEARKGVLD